jgi:site-specific recombinase XerD
MRLATAVQAYRDYKHGLGMKFLSEGFIFAAFCRAFGEIDIAHVQPARVWRFMCPKGQQTRGSEIKYFALRGFYKFAMARGYVSRSPLPTRLTILPQILVPHIYSRDELSLLLRKPSASLVRSARCRC